MPKCPVCSRTFVKKAEILSHVEKNHKDEVPEGLSIAQYIYMNAHDGRMSGICRYCGKETPWNEKASKPYQICGSPACKAKNKEIAQERMMKVYGKTNLLDDPKQQEKMLASRSISGIYKWSDGKHKFTYTGSYEKFAIEWLDKVMDLDPETIQMPGPALPYDFEGEQHWWIPDMYLTEFNLIVEIKDGNENTHPGFAPNRAREEAKDKLMRNQTEFNYVKITHKNMMQLVAVVTDIRISNMTEESKEKHRPVITINESTLIKEVEKFKSPMEVRTELAKLNDMMKTEDKPSMYYENVAKKIELLHARLATLTESTQEIKKPKPRGKQRVIFNKYDMKKVKMFYNEASGHSDRKKEIIDFINNPMNNHKIFLTSDIHFGEKVPGTEVPKIADVWNTYIDNTDMIILLGDISTFDRDEKNQYKYMQGFLERLKCKKVILVLGNNDDLTVKQYYDAGFYYVTDEIDCEYLFTHMPDHVFGDKFNFHGHIHEKTTIFGTNAENHINVYFHTNSDYKIPSLGDYLSAYRMGEIHMTSQFTKLGGN